MLRAQSGPPLSPGDVPRESDINSYKVTDLARSKRGDLTEQGAICIRLLPESADRGPASLESVTRPVVNPMFFRPKSLFVLIFLVVAGLGSISPADAMRLLTTFSELHEMPPPPRPGYRAPADPDTLFYLQRSTNANTIVYAANIDAQGRWDPRNPVEVFWRVFDEDGRRHGLNWIERLLAYGVKVEPVKGLPNEFDAYIVSFPQMKCRIDVSQSGAPECIMRINGRRARLVSAYIELDESGVWPRPIFLNIYGIDTKSGTVLREHVEPAGN